MTVHPGFSVPEEQPGADHRATLKRVLASVKGVLQGKMNVSLEITLTENATSTTVTDSRLSYFSAAFFDPLTANAAAELGTLYVTQANRGNGSWTLTHANSAQTDRTFRMVILG